MKKSELRQLIREQLVHIQEQESHVEPEKGPFPAEFHELMEKWGIQFPGSDKYKVLRETLKKIVIDKGLDAAVDYVIQQFPKYKSEQNEIKSALKTDKIDKPVKFVE